MKSGDGIDEWRSVLPSHVVQKSEELLARVEEMRINQVIYPPQDDVLNALASCAPSEVRAVILGQDPYHEPGQAHGLSFSVQDGIPYPPSLVNIFKELESDLGKPMPSSGNLLRWADQGVLLLNATLTVRAHLAGSHQNRGWETFTDAVIHKLADNRSHLVYILWGSYAQKKGAFIDASHNLVIKSAHPSPLAAYRGFFGSKPFSKANDYLIATGQEPIDW